MVKPINLNRERKTRAKATAAARAAENRIRFGRPKAEKDALRREAERAKRAVDDHRLSDD